MNQEAHDVLVSHGWSIESTAGATGGVTSYRCAALPGNRIGVMPTGAWEHTSPANRNMPARGATARQLARHLAAVHGTVSLADLTLPGRRDDSD